MRQFASQSIESPPWIIAGLLRPGGKLLLFGPPKVGKSLLAIDVSIALEQGTPVWGLFPCKASTVLYIQTEVGEHTLQEHLRQMLVPFPAPGGGKVFLYSTNTLYIDSDLEARSRFEEAILETAPDVVILDPLADMYQGDENKAQDAKQLTGYLNQMSDLYGFSTILVHHMSKPAEGKGRGQEAARGSSVFTAWANSNLACTPYKGKTIVKISFDLRDSEPIDPIILERDKLTLLNRPFEAAVAKSEHGSALLRVVLDAGGAISRADLAVALQSRLETSASYAYRLIRQAISEDQVVLHNDMVLMKGQNE